jgi:hypothetical protein
MTTQFEISVRNKPGEIARIAELLGKSSVNIKGISVHLITEDENTTRRALSGSGLEFTEREILEVAIPDRPGELAKLARTLARTGINIDSLFILSTGSSVTVAMTVNQMEKTKEVLWKYLD